MRALAPPAFLAALFVAPAPAQDCPGDKLASPVAVAFGGFGSAVALDGDTLLVGEDNAGPGRAHVFARGEANAWEHVQLLTPTAPDEGGFGAAVDHDGGRAVVGAYRGGPSGGGSYQGTVTVFAPHGAALVEEAHLLAPDPAGNAWFGFAVDLEGDALVVGEPRAVIPDTVGLPKVGAVHVYLRGPSGWELDQTLQVTDPLYGGRFGWAVELAGTTLLVGQPGLDTVHHYERGPAGFAPVGTLTPPGGAAFEEYGSALALDGDTLAVGDRAGGLAFQDNGLVHLYDRVGGAFVHATSFESPTPTPNDGYAYDLALRGDSLVVGAHEEAFAGGVHRYERTDDAWAFAASHPSFDLEGGDHYGYAVALGDDQLIATATHDDDHGLRAGAVHVIDLDGSDCPDVLAVPDAVALSSATPLAIHLIGDPSLDGHFYFVLASGTGAGPTPFAGLSVAVTPDALTLLTLQYANSLALPAWFDRLDAQGHGTAFAHLPPETALLLAGGQLHVAWLSIGPDGAPSYASAGDAFALTP